MLKLPKGLKKKKKGKKSKHKDDDLFKPEELEAYRREHQQHQQHADDDVQQAAGGDSKPTGSGENEEWRKFLSLTSGVDDILKKTQGDLDRIKSTSFFQRVPPPSEVKKQEEEKQAEVRAEEEAKEEEKRIVAAVEAAIVEVSESESEEDNEDDIFDTAYIDAVAAGEVKLAYIPESPTEEPDDDPFDTTYAEKAILGPNAERKGKKLVPLGSAVEILTGRVQAPSCVPVKRPSTRRLVFKERDLLLGSFDAGTTPGPDETLGVSPTEPVQPSLLDDNAPEELAAEPIDLAKVIIPPVTPVTPSVPTGVQKQTDESNAGDKDILDEFDVLKKVETPEDDDDKEFALLAAESLSKPKQAIVLEPSAIVQDAVPVVKADGWNAFGEQATAQEEEEEQDVDPFDTTFAENILPGQAELKIIEKEILDTDNDLDFNPRAEETYTELIRKNSVSIQLTNPAGQRESLSSLDRVTEDELNSLNVTHRDLLGGSNTDLSQLGDAIQPKDNAVEEDSFDFSDPFDTSGVETVALPGCTELKFLERELLGEEVKVQPARPAVPPQVQIQVEKKVNLQDSVSDDDFDPRAFDTPAPSINRKVSFDLPLTKTDLLNTTEDDSKVSKPLTPYYVRENSIPERDIDPFDTSFAENVAPGQAELKIIESELFSNELDLNSSDFNPRDEKQIAVAKVVQEIEAIVRRPSIPKVPEQVLPTPEPVDLLAVENDIAAKVLTPAAENKSFEEETDIDPFDTSIASNILPGKAELKLLESELITNSVPISEVPIKRNLTDPEFDPRVSGNESVVTNNLNILEAETGQDNSVKPLTPCTAPGKVSFDVGFDEDEDIDPFDTSIANNIGPGPSELKLLESELI